jgi:beta-lactam-binding protein with PASTA domain
MFWAPYLVGSTRSQASSNIYLQNLAVYWVSDPSSSEPTGTILSEVVAWNPDPVSGYQDSSGSPVSEGHQPIVSVGDELGLTVAGGSQNVKVPNVLGLGEDAAVQQMTQAGLVPKPQDECATNVENGVLAEFPSIGTAVEPGSAITLIVNDDCPS